MSTLQAGLTASEEKIEAMVDASRRSNEMNRDELKECLTQNVELTTTVAELELR